MKVAFLAGILSRRASGVRQMVEGLSSHLESSDVEVRVFGIRDAAWTEDQASWKGAHPELFSCLGPVNFGFMPGLHSGLSRFEPDLVHLHGIWMHSSSVAAEWANATKRPMIVSPHGMLAPKALSYSSVRKRIASAMFQSRCFALASGFHATSTTEANDIRAYLGEVRIATVANGVTESKVPLLAWQQRKRRVLALGRIHPVKGYDRLLQAWSLVEHRFPNWNLQISGPDTDGHGKSLRQLVRRLGLNRAQITAPLYGEERDRAMIDSRVFALPSLTENFALTVPEALLASTPVIASTASPWQGLEENRCGWWVPPEVDHLASSLNLAMSMQDDALEGMGEKGRAWALSSFGWPSIAEELKKFYITVAEAG